jgi:hypothetical protein
VGGWKKVAGGDIDEAVARVQAVTDSLLPADKSVPERAKSIAWRAQPHILDEVLWALYERDEKEKKEGEVDIGETDSLMVYMMLWSAVEALDANWESERPRARARAESPVA